MQIQENDAQDIFFSKYTPTNWKNGLTPLNGANLNKVEEALVRLLGDKDKNSTEYIVAKIIEKIEEEVSNRKAGDTDITNIIGGGFTKDDTVAERIKTAQESADKANDSIGGSFNETNTVAKELQAVKTDITAARAQADKGVADAKTANDAIAQIKGDATTEGSITKAVADVKAELKDYADTAESDAVTTAKSYTDGKIKEVSDAASAAQTAIDTHAGKQDNPHKVTAEQIGLGNVDNKSVETIKSEFTGEISEFNEGFVRGSDVVSYLSDKYYTKSQTDERVGELSGLENYYTKDQAIGTGEYVTIDCGSATLNID